MIENKKSEKRKGKEIRKEKKEITPSCDKVVPDYNRDDNNLQGELEKVKAEAQLMRQHALSYIDDVVETMGNALLGRVYDLESKHHRGFEEFVNKVDSQSQAISELTDKVNDMVINRDGLVEVDESRLNVTEAGSSVIMRLEDVQEPPVYKVRGMGWI